MEEKPMPQLEEQPAAPSNTPVFVNYIFKPGLIGSIVCMILWIVGACVAAGFSGSDTSAIFVTIHNVSQTLYSIALVLLWFLFLPALIIGIILLCRRRK